MSAALCSSTTSSCLPALVKEHLYCVWWLPSLKYHKTDLVLKLVVLVSPSEDCRLFCRKCLNLDFWISESVRCALHIVGSQKIFFKSLWSSVHPLSFSFLIWSYKGYLIMSNLFQKYFVTNKSVKKGINGDLQSSFAGLLPEHIRQDIENFPLKKLDKLRGKS